MKILKIMLIVIIVLFYNGCKKESNQNQSVKKNIFNGFSTDKHSIPLEEIHRGGPPKDGIPSINNPKFTSASEASWLYDEDLVVGINQDGVMKAYPLNILVWHEIVNDKINDDNVAITYCPLCGSTLSFKTATDTTFGVSGLLYQSDVLMYDHKTESLWSQLKFEAVAGKRTGEKLEIYPSALTTWKNWKENNPQTLVLSRDTGFKRDYHAGPYEEYKKTTSLMFPVNNQDNRLHPKAEVFVVLTEDKAKAYPLEKLKGKTDLEDMIGNTKVTIKINSNYPIAATTIDKKMLKTFNAYWFAWYTFRPDTLLYE